jgi:hypothetical protein
MRKIAGLTHFYVAWMLLITEGLLFFQQCTKPHAEKRGVLHTIHQSDRFFPDAIALLLPRLNLNIALNEMGIQNKVFDG